MFFIKKITWKADVSRKVGKIMLSQLESSSSTEILSPGLFAESKYLLRKWFGLPRPRNS